MPNIWWRGPGLRYTDLRPYERVQAAIAEGEHLHPGYANEIEAGVSRAWAKVPFQKGGWPGDENLDYSVPERLRSPEGAIYFAGDQLSGLTGWQEGGCLGDLRGSRGDQRTSDGRRSLRRQRPIVSA